ncbi:MAG: hypothetical protein PSN04_03590 [Methyloprofundus sp.]|nr:hypothetical protein [Methyloprofundus sp.]
MEISEQQEQADLLLAGVVRGFSLLMLGVMISLCHFYAETIQLNWLEEDRVWLRTVLYIVAMLTFLVMKFVRHVSLQLNLRASEKSAKSRYLKTIIVSMLMAESIGLYGALMFRLGDGFNTVYIFSILSALAMFLYRPKVEEYRVILQAVK